MVFHVFSIIFQRFSRMFNLRGGELALVTPRSLLRSALQRLLEANLVTCNAFLGACQHAWQWRRCLKALQSMEMACDVISSTCGATAAGDAAQWRRALGLAGGVAPDYSLLSALAAATATGRAWRQAAQVAVVLRLQGLRPGRGFFNSLLRASGRSWRQSMRVPPG